MGKSTESEFTVTILDRELIVLAEVVEDLLLPEQQQVVSVQVIEVRLQHECDEDGVSSDILPLLRPSIVAQIDLEIRKQIRERRFT